MRATVSSVEIELRLEEKNKEEKEALTSVVVRGKCIHYSLLSLSLVVLSISSLCAGLSSSVELVGGTITVGAR